MNFRQTLDGLENWEEIKYYEALRTPFHHCIVLFHRNRLREQ